MSKLFAYLNDQNGASAAECAVLIAVVGVVIAAGANLFGSPAAAAAVNDVATCFRIHSSITAC